MPNNEESFKRPRCLPPGHKTIFCCQDFPINLSFRISLGCRLDFASSWRGVELLGNSFSLIFHFLLMEVAEKPCCR